MNFSHYRNKQTFLVGKNVLIAMVPMLINNDVFEPTYNDLLIKFIVQNRNYFCTNPVIQIMVFSASDKFLYYLAAGSEPSILWFCYASFLFLSFNLHIRWDKLGYAMGTKFSVPLQRFLFPGSHSMSIASWQRDSARHCHSGIKLIGLHLNQHV